VGSLFFLLLAPVDNRFCDTLGRDLVFALTGAFFLLEEARFLGACFNLRLALSGVSSSGSGVSGLESRRGNELDAVDEGPDVPS